MSESDYFVLQIIGAVAAGWVLVAFGIAPVWKRRRPHHPCPYCAAEIPISARECPSCKKPLKY